MNLQEIATGFDAFEAAIEASDGELTEELAAQHDALNLAERDKLDGYAFYMKSLQGDAQKYRQLADELYAKQQRALKRYDWLKDRLKYHMLDREVTEMRGDLYKFALVKSGKPPVEILVEPEHLPREWVTMTITPNKEVIRKALQSGEPYPPVAKLGEATQSVRIF
jgi:hypothetical protein